MIEIRELHFDENVEVPQETLDNIFGEIFYTKTEDGKIIYIGTPRLEEK